MRLKKLTAALLAAMMVLGLTACAPESAKWIATNNGENVPAGIYLAYLMNAYSLAGAEVEDQEKDVLKQQVEGVPAAEWITKKADDDFAKYLAVENKFVEQGLALSDYDLASLNQQLQYQWQFMAELYDNNGVSLDSFTKVVQSDYKKSMLFDAQYGKEGKTPIDEAQILKTFEDGYYKATYITMSLTNPDGTEKDEAGKKAAMDKANEVLAKATAPGAVYANVILDYEKAQAKEDGKEESTVHEHDAASHVSFLPIDSTGYEGDFLKTVGEMKTDEIRVLTSGTTIYILQKMDITKDSATDVENYRGTIMKTLKGDEFDATVQSWAEATPVQYNEAAKKMYKPSVIKLD